MIQELVPNTFEYFQTAKENQFFDRKSARIKPDDIVRHLVAFANASGGTLVIGIENDGRITGFRGNGAHQADEFKTVAIKRLLDTPITFQTSEIAVTNEKGEKDVVLVLEVAASHNKVIQSFDREVYLRQAGESVKLNYEQRTQLLYDKGQRYFEDEVADRSSIDDVDEKVMSLYRKHMRLPNKPAGEILEARGMLVDGKLTTAGVLLFGKNPTKYLPQARLRFIRYDGMFAETGKRLNIVKEQTFDSAIPIIISEARNFINTQMREFQYLNSEGIFERMPEYPEFAWFEGIVNALTHRNYSMNGEHIKFIMFDDRIEIYSPGLLPNIVTVENIMHTRYSRNPKIARVLSEFGWVKEMNEGVKRIYSEMQSLFLKDPIYSEPGHQVLLTLENNILNRQARITDSLKKKLTPEIFNELNANEIMILQYTIANGRITTANAIELTKKSKVTVIKMLRKLERENFLLWNGTNKYDPTQYYTLYEEGSAY
ncbi:MAG TPA: ATP-binding protein [Bacillota bacterium]|jgi:ATP-dependent DNA helicase RecG|nr:ATP-binding protein [Bacillota bacterium]